MDTVLVTAVGAPPGLNCIRSLSETGRFRLVAADADQRSPALYMHGEHVILPRASDRAYLPMIVEAIRKFGIDVIMPCIEEELFTLVQAKDQIRQAGARLLAPEPSILARACDKGECTKLAAANGIDCPKTAPLPHSLGAQELKARLSAFASACPPPWIVKPIYGHGMRDVIRVHSIAEAVQALERIRADALVQEFIPSPVGNMFIVGLMCGPDGEVKRRFSSRSIQTLYPEGGPATAGIAVRRDDIIEETVRLLTLVGGWRGPAMVEWLRDVRDGSMKFIEINPRIWGYSYLATGAGLNFPEAAVDLCMGRSIPADPGFREGTTMIRVTRDLIFDQPPYPPPA